MLPGQHICCLKLISWQHSERMHHNATCCTTTPHNATFMSSNIFIPKKCQHCGDLFTARTTVTKYCGEKCAKRAYKARKRKEKINSSLEETQKQEPTPKTETSSLNSNLSQKEFLSITEASKLIGVSRWTIQRMIKRKELKAVRFGRKQIIAREHIKNLFKL